MWEEIWGTYDYILLYTCMKFSRNYFKMKLKEFPY